MDYRFLCYWRNFYQPHLLYNLNFLIWLFLVLFFAVRPVLKRTGIKVFLRVNNQKITIKKQKVFGKVTKRDRANIYFLEEENESYNV